jgi:hypothetical protein
MEIPMEIAITPELRDAVQAAAGAPIRLVDQTSQQALFG